MAGTEIIAPTPVPVAPKPLRVWPGVVIVVLQLLIRFVLPVIAPQAKFFAVIGGLIGGILVALWWLLFSRARWLERIVAIVLMVAAFVATRPALHPSVATGMMGLMFLIYVIPVLSAAFVVWAVVTRRLPDVVRRVSMVATILLACGVFLLLRTEGMTGEAESEFKWRWTPTFEQQLLAKAREEPALTRTAPAETKATADWPGFRGPDRNGVIHGMRIATNWSASPPIELWRRQVGPGWSSFSVQGDRFYTQEQRGEEEVVACYSLTTGQPIWKHEDPVRFWESNAGAGPRATPTLSKERVYAFGATGVLNALNAADGSVVWSRNAASDTGSKLPGWGFAGSPLVLDDLVIVATAGALVAYDLPTGNQRWLGPSGGSGYSSPQLATIGGVAQVLLLNGSGVISVAPATGALLWEHKYPGDGIVQPGLTAEGDVLIGTGSGIGTGGRIGVRRISVTCGAGGWTVEERWTAIGLKPYFNDFVVHKGHAYGFDGGLISCIDLKDGQRKWKGGRYGYGQLVLLAEQDLLLILSEQGELALVEAAEREFNELARFPAIQGKTWNHPVLAGDVLLVRNAQEMAAFRLAPSRPK